MTAPEAFPTFLSREACYSDCINAKNLFIKEANCLLAVPATVKIFQLKNFYKSGVGFFLSLSNISNLSFLYFEFKRSLKFHISEECLTFQTISIYAL